MFFALQLMANGDNGSTKVAGANAAGAASATGESAAAANVAARTVPDHVTSTRGATLASVARVRKQNL